MLFIKQPDVLYMTDNPRTVWSGSAEEGPREVSWHVPGEENSHPSSVSQSQKTPVSL